MSKKLTYYGYSFASLSPDFIMLVKTDNAGTSASDQFTIPTIGSGYNYDVDWGDGNTSAGVTGNITHTFPTAGNYVVKISGAFPRIYFNNGGDRRKLLEVQNWGNIAWTNMENSFYGCENMTITATDAPDLSSIINMNRMFQGAASFNQNINHWDVSNVAYMIATFWQATAFNQPLDNWDVSSVISTNSMFYSATSFNQDISGWNVIRNTNMGAMFWLATSFDNNLASWNLRTLGVNLANIFRQSGMSTANYTDTIVGWGNYVITNSAPYNTNMSNQTGRTFDTSRAGGANFANAGAARTYLTTATPTGAGWTISGDSVI